MIIFFTLKTFGGKTKFPKIGGQDAAQLKRFCRFTFQLAVNFSIFCRRVPLSGTVTQGGTG